MRSDTDALRHRGELYAAIAAMGFGSAYVATSFALHGFAPLPAAFWRSALAANVLAGIAAALLGERPTPLQLAGGALVLAGMAAVTLPVGLVGRSAPAVEG